MSAAFGINPNLGIRLWFARHSSSVCGLSSTRHSSSSMSPTPIPASCTTELGIKQHNIVGRQPFHGGASSVGSAPCACKWSIIYLPVPARDVWSAHVIASSLRVLWFPRGMAWVTRFYTMEGSSARPQYERLQVSLLCRMESTTDLRFVTCRSEAFLVNPP